MGPRQLALIFAIGTAVIGLAIAACRMALGFSEFGNGIIATVVLFVVAAVIQMRIAKRKWDLDYKNAFVMLLSTTVLCSFIYAFGYYYVENAFPDTWDDGDGHFQFWPLFFANVTFRVLVDAIAAIFHKR